jgi:site-specific DNA recombinase
LLVVSDYHGFSPVINLFVPLGQMSRLVRRQRPGCGCHLTDSRNCFPAAGASTLEASMNSVPSPLIKIEKYVSIRAKYARDRDTITPRNGTELVVLVAARISGGPRQKELSKEDQVDNVKELVSELYAGAVEIRIIATTGKGEDLERPELKVMEDQLRSRENDLFACDDIGRVVRGNKAAWLVGIGVDHGTRFKSINDCIDTDDDGWEQEVNRACNENVGNNIQTSKRIKQKKQNRFRKFGGSTPIEIAGYYKPKDANSYDDWRKIDEASPIIQEGLRLLNVTHNYSRVAKYFNDVGFKPGPYSRRKDGTWDGKMVRRFYGNTLLGGKPGRGYRHTIKHHERGKRISVPNPNGPDFINCPHLAHVDHDELVVLNELLRQENSKLGRKPVNGVDPRFRVPRKTTIFPSQHARCYYCGFHYIRGGNGIVGHIGCSNIRDWHCWNSVGVSCETAATAVMCAINEFVYELDKFDNQFKDLVEQVHRERVGVSADQWRQLEAEDIKVAREIANLIDSMKMFGPTPEIKAALDDVKQRQQHLARERRGFENHSKRELQLPRCVGELRAAFEEKADGLATGSPEFGDLLRQLAPEFHIYLVRLLDGGHLMPRARVKLDLTGCISDLVFVPGMSPLLSRVVTLDLFVPPQRERIREEAVRLADTGLQQREIAERLPEKTFQVVVQKAIALDRMMKARRQTSPYEVLGEPPADYTKLRRHRNARYLFKPLEGYERPPI